MAAQQKQAKKRANYFVTPAKVQEWVGLFADGVSAAQIARTYDVHLNTVWHHLKKLGISRQKVAAAQNTELVNYAAKRIAK